MLTLSAWAQTSLQERINAATDGATITLTEDVTLNNTLTINKSIVIDGGSHKLTSNVDKTSIISVSGTGSFEMKNLTVYAAKTIARGNDGGTNADILINTTGKVTITGCTFDGVANAYYNVIEWGQNVAVADGTTISNNTFKGAAIRHNCINFYTEAANATINVTDNNFENIQTDKTNGLRISNYTSANATINVTGNTMTNTEISDYTYAGLVLFQNNQGSCSNLATDFSNNTINGAVASSNGTGTKNQICYGYTADKKVSLDSKDIPAVTGIKMPVAQIGNTYYENLTAAFAAVTTDTKVTLLANTTEQLIVPNSSNITLDLNGHKIEHSETAIVNNGTLTIKDTGSNGKIVSTGNVGVAAGNNSTTTIESGIIESVEGAVITGKSVGATITIKGGTFSASDNAVIAGNGSARDGNANTITINGGTFNGQIKSAGYVACGIYAPWKDVITVNGGTFNITGGCGVLARAGSVTINGGTFNCSGTATGKVGDSRVVVPCSAIVYDSQAAYPAMTAESKIEVPSTSTAKFTAANGVAVSVIKNGGADSHIAISGGTYSSAVPEECCADGFIPKDNGDGTYGVKEETHVAKIGDVQYPSLAAAIEAATAGQTVTLLENITATTVNEYTITKAITLDLAGHTITSSVEQPIWIKDSGDLTITGSGTIAGPTGDAGKALDGKAIITVEGGKLTYLNGTLTCGGVGSDGMYGVYILNGGTAVFGEEAGKTGPTITSWFAAIGENNTTAPANITVYGGSYTAQASPSESDWWHYFCAPLYAAGSGVINISGGEFNGYYAVSSRYSNVDQDLNIKGGTFTGTKQALFIDNQTGVASDSSRDVAVSGGTFSSAVPEEYCADGYIPTDNGDGTYGVKTGKYVAKIGETEYETLAAAITAATDGQTVTLLTDINESVENTNTNNFTIDLNGKTWTSDASSTFKNNGGTVTIKDASGNGTVKNTATAKDTGIAVWARTGSVIIESGNFISQSNYEATLYVGTSATNLGDKKPTITVTGGTFKNEASGQYAYKSSLLPLTLNVINSITYQAIIISGGTFYGNDPALGDDNLGTEVAGGNFLADGYVTETSADGTFGVKPGVFVAQIGEKKYETLAAAITAATDGQTVTLLADVTVDKTILIEKNITIDGAGHTITSSVKNNLGAFYVNVPASNFTIKNAMIDGGNTASMAVCAYRGKAKGDLTGTVSTDNNNSGNHITLTDCTVKNFTGYPNSYAGAVYAFSTSTFNLTNCTFTGNTTALSTNGASGADVWAGAAATVNISGGSYQEVFVNSDSSNEATINVSNNATIAELAVCVSYKNDGSTNIPTIVIDNSTVTTLNTEEGNPIPANDITIKNGGSITNMPATEVAKILNGKNTKAFASLDEAITEANADVTITLLADAAATVEPAATVTIDAASHAVTLPTFTVADGYELAYAKVTNATDNIYKVTTATYRRNGAADTHWGTVCLPFSFESAPEGYTLYTPTAVADNVLTVTEVTYPVAAGTPVIFCKSSVAEATMTITSSDASVKIDAAPVEQSGTLALVGTFTQQKIESGLSSIYYINGDKFHQAKASLTVPAYRAYIKNTSTGAKAGVLSIVVAGDATAIDAPVFDDLNTAEAIYDINGRQLTAPQKGINIMKLANGKTVKLIVK